MLPLGVKRPGPARCSLQLCQSLAYSHLRDLGGLFLFSGVPDIKRQFCTLTVNGEQRGCAGFSRQQCGHGGQLEQLLNGRQPKRQTRYSYSLTAF
ncbi:hypothetical protein D3C87_1572070 [compost metagenome]